jgi:glycosyltransferase involved in cell wall biosynthesis
VTRVLHVTECFAGGVMLAVESAVRLADGHEHHLLWSGDDVPDESMFTSVTSFPKGFSSRVRAVRAAVAKIEPDVVHAHSSWAGVYTRVRRMDVPVVYQPHCYKFVDAAQPKPLRWGYYAGEALLAGRTAEILVLSPHEDDLAKRLRAKVRRRMITNVATLRPSDRILPRRTGAEHVVMCGRIVKQKDPEYFLQVAEVVRQLRPGTQFTWIGDGSPEARAQLEAGGVHVTGWLRGDEMAAELLSPSVYFHSAGYEGFPLSVLDAAAFGQPIVAREIAAFDGTALLRVSGVQTSAEVLVDVLNGGDSRDKAIGGSRALDLAMSEPKQRSALRDLYRQYGEFANVPAI